MFAILLLVLSFAEPPLQAAQTVSLAGTWSFAIDRNDSGVREDWFNQELKDRINLPGALQSQGYGDEISTKTPWVLSLYDKLWFLRADYQAYTNSGNVTVPFLCQPPRHYLGAAWYQREIEIPEDWRGRRVMLFLERPHWESRVWLDDRWIGTNNSLCAPHEYELGAGLAPGKHRLTVRVDDRLLMPYRPDAHAISDSLGSTWNGVAGKMELRSTPVVWIEDVEVFPKASGRSVTVKGVLGNASGAPATNFISISFIPRTAAGGGGGTLLEVACGAGLTKFEAGVTNTYPPAFWSEFNPALFELTVLNRPVGVSNGSQSEVKRIVFGFREFKGAGSDLEINGRKAHLRGTHHGGDFPLTGYPPTDLEYWRKLIRTCQDWGLNHMRFHSFCPPDAAFEAADELGFYLQPEPGMWNTFDPGSPMERMLYLETERMIKAYGNHPSFVMLSPSNEPKGRWRQVLPRWAHHFRELDPRRLYTSGTGFTDADAPGPIDEVDFVATQRVGSRRVRGEPGWFGGDYSSSLDGVNVPVIAHELGQWCAYPDYEVINKFTGYMRAGNYEIFRDSLATHGLLAKNKDFTWASGRFQLACYKEEIEANLRTRKLAGFQLLDLHDYVGQGTALVGLLDPFWESKGYVTPEEFRKFCNTIVPLVRLARRTFTTADKFSATVEIAHFGDAEMTNATVNWRIEDRSGHAVAHGNLPVPRIALGRNVLGNIATDLSKLASPRAYRLVVSVEAGAGGPATAAFQNDWNFWLYPAQDSAPIPSDVFVTRFWEEAAKHLAAGEKVMFVPRNTDLDWTCPPLAEVPVFWNRLMNPAWSRMLGLWCDTNHPALSEFPTEPNCDWQWTQLMRGARAINLDRLPRGLQPMVQAIDDWNRNWKLGVVFECKVGKGRLVVSSIDLITELDRRPVARQLRRSLLDYMAGAGFEPKSEVSAAELSSVLFDNRIMQKLGARVAGGGASSNALIDGDPNTIWNAGGTGRGANGTRHPHAITFTFPAAVAMNGLVLMPRQNDRDHLGDVREYLVESSDDGQQWETIKRGELASTWSPQRVMFDRVERPTQLRFTALSGFGSDTSAALAELAVLYVGPALADRSAAAIEYQRSRSTSADVDESTEAVPNRTNAPPSNR